MDFDLGSLGDLAKQMEKAYGDGMGAMDKAGEEVAKGMKADHEIEVDISLEAKVEGHEYAAESKIIFEIELKPVLQASGGDLSKVLDGLEVDLGDDKEAVMEQLGQPRAVGVVKEIETKKLEVSNKKGKVKTELNKKGTILATVKGEKICLNFEGVLSYPKNPGLFVAIPSMEKMEKNVVVGVKEMGKKKEFSWVEKDKDNLKVSGSVKIVER